MKDKYSTILDYLDWRGDLSFDQAPFCEVDALIFSQLTYNKLSGILDPGFDSKITMKALAEKFQKSPDYKERCNIGAMINGDIAKLLVLCGESKRFGNVEVTGYKKIFDEAVPVQYSSELYILHNKDRNIVAAFEGTDDSFAGWHEDFQLSYNFPYPSAVQALNYLNSLKKIKGNIILTGHSKGGSNSVYAALYGEPKIVKRIQAIYNFDGPGFSQAIIDSQEFQNIKDRLFSFYPKFSVVGMVFCHDKKYSITHSMEHYAMQHDPCSWAVLGNQIVKEEKFDDEAQFLSKSANQWLESTPKEQKKYVIETLFSVLEATEVHTNLELEKNKMVCSGKILKALASFDSEQKKSIQNTVTALMKIGKTNLPMLNIFQMKEKTEPKEKSDVKNPIEKIGAILTVKQ